jgi:hypothetical protein
MAQCTHGKCIAKCIVCHKAILFDAILQRIDFNYNWNPSDPMTPIKKHYRLFHPFIFSIMFRDMKNGGDRLKVTFHQ